ncbi:putative wd domain containing protein [Diaporthe ampelina]|uniref:Putative wd domain containing protein n=1 Tax=Diaporthe ampelina TaxID=1214573 RepID=A0A0G2HT28_9PEZI|nr:putative wd domain containing protein [Diaporthe ampelina]
MINATSYTPLESLLLFTWIRKTGAEAFEAAAFPRLSRDLINNDSIKEDPTYDASRLNPDSLQELFLQLLQDELKNEATQHQQQDATPADASLSPNSKKRKRPGSAPQLTNLHEARQHAHRLPDAEAKLWAKYKQRTAQQLWEEQEELGRLEDEIREIQSQQQKRQAAEADKLRKSASIRLNHHPLRCPCLGRLSGSRLISHILYLNIKGRLRTMRNSLHNPGSNAHSNGIQKNSSSNNTCNILPNPHYSQSNKATGSNIHSSKRSSKGRLGRLGHDKSLSHRSKLVKCHLSCTQRL